MATRHGGDKVTRCHLWYNVRDSREGIVHGVVESMLNALVLGYGRSGKAAETLLGRLGFAVTVLDGEVPFPGGEFSVAVVSPGVALTHPWIVEAKRRGIPLKSELQLGCEELKRQGWKLLAVTGSKGKSSVVKLVAESLGGVPCGNYGLPVCEVANTHSQPTTNCRPPTFLWAVVEVSSFMMETTNLPPDTFQAAAILNLQEDHLDRHGSVKAYHALKYRLLGMTRQPIEGGGDVSLSLWVGSYFDNEVLSGNAAIAVKLMRAAGLDDVRVAAAFRDFVPLPHRMNLVAEIGGVRYIDDSKATSLAALAAGVKMASSFLRPSLRLIAGGLPKGDDPRSVLPVLTERVRKVYLIGQSAEAFCAVWKSAVDCEICGSMERAVECAKREVEFGETVLLSPGAASFDQFKGFGERGDVFARLVKEKENDK